MHALISVVIYRISQCEYFLELGLMNGGHSGIRMCTSAAPAYALRDQWNVSSRYARAYLDILMHGSLEMHKGRIWNKNAMCAIYLVIYTQWDDTLSYVLWKKFTPQKLCIKNNSHMNYLLFFLIHHFSVMHILFLIHIN